MSNDRIIFSLSINSESSRKYICGKGCLLFELRSSEISQG